MNKSGFSTPLAVAAGFLVYAYVAPGTALAQSPSPASGPPPTIAAPPAAQPRQAPHQVTDDFAGLNYTDEQQAKIDDIRRNMKARMDVVAKDSKLNPEQKQAMLEGLQRMEVAEIFKVLTPEQQKEVRQRATARRAAQQQRQKAQQQPTSVPR